MGSPCKCFSKSLTVPERTASNYVFRTCAQISLKKKLCICCSLYGSRPLITTGLLQKYKSYTLNSEKGGKYPLVLVGQPHDLSQQHDCYLHYKSTSLLLSRYRQLSWKFLFVYFQAAIQKASESVKMAVNICERYNQWFVYQCWQWLSKDIMRIKISTLFSDIGKSPHGQRHFQAGCGVLHMTSFLQVCLL